MISVIIPTKGRNSLIRTLATIEDQTYENTEIIVIEDFEKTGACRSRNAGVPKANGKYYFFCDDDVELKKDCFEKLKNALDKNPDASYAYCKYHRKGKINSDVYSREFDKEVLKRINFISTMSLIRKEDFIGWDESLDRFQDWDMWLTMLEQGKTGVFVDEFLFTANYDGDCITTEEEEPTKIATAKIMEKHGI